MAIVSNWDCSLGGWLVAPALHGPPQLEVGGQDLCEVILALPGDVARGDADAELQRATAPTGQGPDNRRIQRPGRHYGRGSVIRRFTRCKRR